MFTDNVIDIILVVDLYVRKIKYISTWYKNEY